MLLAGLADPSADAAETPSPASAAIGGVAGDRTCQAVEEFGRFYERSKLLLRAYLASATRDAGLADDLTQEAFIRLYTARGPFANDEHRRRYLFRIASNLLADHWRAARHRALPLDEASLESSSRTALAERSTALDSRRDLSRALSRLVPRDRQLVWLAHVEHWSHKEIADILGVGSASVRVLLFRARRRLAELLRGLPHEPQPEQEGVRR